VAQGKSLAAHQGMEPERDGGTSHQKAQNKRAMDLGAWRPPICRRAEIRQFRITPLLPQGVPEPAMTVTDPREAICRLGASIFARGLTFGSSGNISVRLDDGRWLMTPTNASLGDLDPARLSLIEADGTLVSGDAPGESGEGF
jgi:hypothetical protein